MKKEDAQELANVLELIRGHLRHPRESAPVPNVFQASLGESNWNDLERGSTRMSADGRGLSE